MYPKIILQISLLGSSYINDGRIFGSPKHTKETTKRERDREFSNVLNYQTKETTTEWNEKVMPKVEPFMLKYEI